MLLFIKIEVVLQGKTGFFPGEKYSCMQIKLRAKYNSGACTEIIAGGGLTFYDVLSIPRWGLNLPRNPSLHFSRSERLC